MQPTYLPWMGYFALIDACDVFVLDDQAQFTSKSWHSRNRIRQRTGETVWLTVPVHGHRAPLNTIRIAGHGWKNKHYRTIKAAYSHAPGWPLVDGVLQETGWHRGLSNITGHLIDSLAKSIGITTDIVRASELFPQRTGMADRIADMCQAVGATTLVNTPTAQAYLDESMIGLPIEWLDYQHPSYPQPPHHDFTSHLSILDCLAHCGTDTLTTIRSGTYATECEPREQRASKR